MPPADPLPAWPTLDHERSVPGVVCGVDEAGCAPIAGPVVAAAVVLPPGPRPPGLDGLTDSKLLTARARERLFDAIHEVARVGVGIASVAEIDALNILRADLLAMRRAVEALGAPPDHALVDGRTVPDLGCAVTTLVKGDRRSLSIAAASVVAKVRRDRLMHGLAARFPDYGWATNAGYGTDEHYLGLLRRGPCEHHRRSFAPLTTLFAEGARWLRELRFAPAPRAERPRELRLLELRRDLHAVFDGAGLHLGVLKNARGGWRLRALGYDAQGTPLRGAGPLAHLDGTRLAAPELDRLRELLRG